MTHSGNTTRRDFLWSAGAIAGAVAANGVASAAEPHLTFPTKPRERLAVTSWPFRALIDAPGNHDRDRTKPGMDLKEFAATVARRFDVHNINPLAGHFTSTSPDYIRDF